MNIGGKPCQDRFGRVLSVSGLAIPVKMYVATQTHPISFHLLHKKCLTRPKQVLHCNIDDEYFSIKDTVRSYEIAKDRYVVLDESDFQKVPIRTSRTIDIQCFIDGKEIEPTYYYDGHYLCRHRIERAGAGRSEKPARRALDRTLPFYQDAGDKNTRSVGASRTGGRGQVLGVDAGLTTANTRLLEAARGQSAGRGAQGGAGGSFHYGSGSHGRCESGAGADEEARRQYGH